MVQKFFYPTEYFDPFDKEFKHEIIVVTEDSSGLVSASPATVAEIVEYENMKSSFFGLFD